LNALVRLLTERLGVEPQVWLRYMNEELAEQVGRLEKERRVVGYDEEGNPVREEESEKGHDRAS
ncbi:MAG: hypothetical protein ACE5JL_13405, partial [Dehalococcoidia bacterium]